MRMTGKAVIVSCLVISTSILTGCRDREAELAAAYQQGFCTSYVRGLAQAAFSMERDWKVRDQINDVYLTFMRKVDVSNLTLEAWSKGYFDGDVRFRSMLPDWANAKDPPKKEESEAAFNDFQVVCKQQLAPSE